MSRPVAHHALGERHFFAGSFPLEEKDDRLESSERKGRKIDVDLTRFWVFVIIPSFSLPQNMR
jgi:hypothetical protein